MSTGRSLSSSPRSKRLETKAAASCVFTPSSRRARLGSPAKLSMNSWWSKILSRISCELAPWTGTGAGGPRTAWGRSGRRRARTCTGAARSSCDEAGGVGLGALEGARLHHHDDVLELAEVAWRTRRSARRSGAFWGSTSRAEVLKRERVQRCRRCRRRRGATDEQHRQERACTGHPNQPAQQATGSRDGDHDVSRTTSLAERCYSSPAMKRSRRWRARIVVRPLLGRRLHEIGGRARAARP